jgi:hypothetical protein
MQADRTCNVLMRVCLALMTAQFVCEYEEYPYRRTVTQ